MKKLTLLIVAVSGSALWILNAQPAAPQVYTEAQAEAGRLQYRSQQPGIKAGSACIDCHTETLLGRTGDRPVPPLAGADFLATWGPLTTQDLFARIKLVKPLTEEAYLNLIAYILQVNGGKPGPRPLTTAAAVEIRSATSPR